MLNRRIGRQLLLESAFVTPSCTTANMTMEGAERVPDLRRRLPRLCAANTLDGISTGGTAGHSLHMKRSSFKVKFKSEKGDALCRKGWHILDKGISHVYIKLHSPRLNGKVGRSDWIEEEEFYCLFDGVVIDDAHLFSKLPRSRAAGY